MSLWVKICGVTREADVEAIVAAGADAIGLNFALASPRRVSAARARELVRAVPAGAVTWVGVFVDADREELARTRDEVGLDLLQLHGNEAEDLRASFGAEAYKAVRIATREDVEAARLFAGDRLLVDAKVAGAMGGTGATFDWSLVRELVAERNVVLAGGLGPENVARAVREVRPFGIDTASGVESSPGVKDANLVRAFVERARAAGIG